MSASAIRPARPDDAPALWAILEQVIRAGEICRTVRAISGKPVKSKLCRGQLSPSSSSRLFIDVIAAVGKAR